MAPKVKIGQHIAVFGTLCGVGSILAFGTAKTFGSSEEDKAVVRKLTTGRALCRQECIDFLLRQKIHVPAAQRAETKKTRE